MHAASLVPPGDAWLRRYLAFLGIDGGAPSLDALAALVRAHLLAVPFENATALLRRRAHPGGAAPDPDPETLLANWERRAGGGVCFEIVPMIARLLAGLGYEAHVVLGQISLPNGHQAVHVALGGRRYLVDLGNGAPFFAPIPLDELPHEIRRHGLAYRFDRGAHDAELLQDRLIDGTWTTYCRYDLRPATREACDAGYQHHHTPNASWVTGTLTMVRCTEDAVHALRDDTLTHYTAAGRSVETIAGDAAYRRLASGIYGLPALDIDGALAMRRALSDAGPAGALPR